MKVTAIYDNGGKTLDQYTFLTDVPETDAQSTPNLFMALGTSNTGVGFSQWCTAVPGRHLGKRVHFEDLNAELQEHVARRMFIDD